MLVLSSIGYLSLWFLDVNDTRLSRSVDPTQRGFESPLCQNQRNRTPGTAMLGVGK